MNARAPVSDTIAFLRKYPCDERAREFLNASSPEVRARVVQEFRPRTEGDSDYSGAVTFFVRRIRQFAAEKGQPELDSQVGGSRGMQATKGGSRSNHAIEAFLQKSPCDERAQEFLKSSPPEVRARVMQDFRPRTEGDSNYSGAVTSFVRRIRQYAEEDQQRAQAANGGWGLAKRPRLQ